LAASSLLAVVSPPTGASDVAGFTSGATAWREIFQDAELNQLETQAAEANQELKAAVARFAQARAAADVARSGLFPRIGAGFSASRQRESAKKPQSSTGQASGKASTYDNFVLPFDLSYEVDLWGRVRRQVESARAKEQADAADLEGVEIAIAAEVAADYFTLRALDAETIALRATIEANRKSLDLTRNRRAGALRARPGGADWTAGVRLQSCGTTTRPCAGGDSPRPALRAAGASA
jgi:multidrug efflux system outer membrane protein